MIVLSRDSAPAERWLAHLLRASEASIRLGDCFDDDMPFEDERVFGLARRQRVAPLLHRAIVDGSVTDILSPAFQDDCEQIYYATLRKNLIALESGREVLEALDEMGVIAVPLKGWDFLRGSSPLYDDPGTRPMDDLDLMVRPADHACAESVLYELGFRAVTNRAAALAGGHEIAYHRRVAGIDLFLELHWAWSGRESLMRPFAVSGDRFIDELCEADGEGGHRPTQSGRILFAAVHAARHTLDRWIWMVDLHRLVTADPVDWKDLLDSARRLRVRRPLYAALLATRQLLRTAIPREVIASVAPGPVRRLLLQRSLAASLRPGSPPRAAWTAKLLLGESWWDVARTAAWAAAPGAAWHHARGRAATPSQPLSHAVSSLRTVAGR